mmetsp:Transcript_16635/g.42997  ORF Transcript_16635/g.42997 Transcript_16635/m.42997 type:complete len:690 (-) Transcript_16635:94-2163(-)
MDGQQQEYREAQRHRFEASKAVAEAAAIHAPPMTPGMQAMAADPGGRGGGRQGGGGLRHTGARTGACAEALKRQLSSALGGCEQTAATLEVLRMPQLQHGLLQWALLDKLGGRRTAAVAATTLEASESWTSPLRRALSCVGEADVVPGADDLGGLDLDALLRWRSALEALLMSGGCSNWPVAVGFLCRLLPQDDHASSLGFRVRLAVACALCYAEGATDPNMHEAPIDFVERYYCFVRAAKDGLLFAGFEMLTAWHLRYVVGSWHADGCLDWARQNVNNEVRHPDKVGEAARMVRYKDFNESGVSVQEGLRFYDGKKSTMPVIFSYGGVCGAVSKFGASACQAFGVPAMPVGQPGHCAMIWRAPGGEWILENDNSGLSQSRMHDGIQRTWQELGSKSEEVGIISVMEQAQGMFSRYVHSEVIRWASRFVQNHCASLELLLEAVAACPFNLLAWSALLRQLARATAVGARMFVETLQTHVVAAESAMGSSPYDLSLMRPVRGSMDQDRALNVVDGTSSEWFPASEEPQWLVIDLQRTCFVASVRVQWWGDYGTKTDLRVSSSHSEEAQLTYRGRREVSADFNGWSDFTGWTEPTRILRLDFSNPQPDCFGCGKQYGLRQVKVMGRRCDSVEDGPGQEPKDLLARWIEGLFSTSRQADIQAQGFVRHMFDAEAWVLRTATASTQEDGCVIC